MELTETINLVISIFTLMGMVFAVFFYFKKPQIKAEQFDALIEEKFANHERNQAAEFKNRDERLIDLRLALQNLKDNDLHSIGMRQDQFAQLMIDLTKSVVRLETIIDERIPRGKGGGSVGS